MRVTQAKRRFVAITGSVVTVVVVALVVATTLVYAFGVPKWRDFNEELTHAAGPSLAINASDATFGLQLQPSGDGLVHVSASGGFRGGLPTVEFDARGSLFVSCPFNGFQQCSLEVTVAVPVGTDVSVDTGAGSVESRDLDGRIRVNSALGDVVLLRHTGEVSARTSSGDVTIRTVGPEPVEALATDGDIRITAQSPPSAVNAHTANGDVSVNVPNNVTYAVTAKSAADERSLSTVPEDPNSPRRITARSTAGIVSVRPL